MKSKNNRRKKKGFATIAHRIYGDHDPDLKLKIQDAFKLEGESLEYELIVPYHFIAHDFRYGDIFERKFKYIQPYIK